MPTSTVASMRDAVAAVHDLPDQARDVDGLGHAMATRRPTDPAASGP